MTRNKNVDEGASDDWWTLISLTRPRDAYPHFLANKGRIEALLRAGHSMHRVWEAYRKGSLPFPASYETFRTYCVKHGLSGLRREALSPEAAREEASGVLGESVTARSASPGAVPTKPAGVASNPGMSAAKPGALAPKPGAHAAKPAARASKPGSLSSHASGSLLNPGAPQAPGPKVWPRITEKPREFIPRIEDD